MNNSDLIITIDGPAGVGKTTLARKLAASLDIAYLDTGAMFRAVGWLCSKSLANPGEHAIQALLQSLNFGIEGTGWDSHVTLNGNRLGSEIRTEEAGMQASNMGRYESVRSYLKDAQQKIGSSMSLVAEGRDMGSVVFPLAPFKFFLDASAEVRAWRRHAQLAKVDKGADYEVILDLIIKRDEQDRNRSIAPLKPAPDAIIIDTSQSGPDEVFNIMKQHIK